MKSFLHLKKKKGQNTRKVKKKKTAFFFFFFVDRATPLTFSALIPSPWQWTKGYFQRTVKKIIEKVKGEKKA